MHKSCVLAGLTHLGMTGEQICAMAAGMRALSGQYDQASRAAVSL